ncbi:MAG: MarR family winged helix-turn-helix transcriptional regulator [Methylocystaceae bacterium]
MNERTVGGFLISRIHYLSGRLLAKKLKVHGLAELNPAQGRILFVLWKQDQISIQELARATSLGKSTLTSMLDRLEQSGYIERIPSPDDRRITLIATTAKDLARREAYAGVSQEMSAQFYHGFTPEEIARFESDLARILLNLEAAQ